jgi:hypothetical protein
MTKNISTPSNPPGKVDGHRLYNRVIMMAIALSPSISAL